MAEGIAGRGAGHAGSWGRYVAGVRAPVGASEGGGRGQRGMVGVEGRCALTCCNRIAQSSVEGEGGGQETSRMPLPSCGGMTVIP